MLVTLNDTKAYLGIPTLTTDYDAWLLGEIAYISEAIEIYCKRRISLYEYTETIHMKLAQEWMRFREFMLWQFPVTELVSIKVDGEDIDVILHPESGILKDIKIPVWHNDGKIVVVYKAGYATTPVIIQNVIYSIIQERYNKKKSGIDVNYGTDVQRISIPGTISIDYDYTLTNNDVNSNMGAILGNYRNLLGNYRSNRVIMGEGLHYVTGQPV